MKMLPGVERGKVEGLYYIPIIYPVGLLTIMFIVLLFLVWFSIKYPYEGNREQPSIETTQEERDVCTVQNVEMRRRRYGIHD